MAKEFDIVSDIPAWGDLFQKLVNERAKIAGSPLGELTKTASAVIVNTAFTEDQKTGEKFFYFEAVDIGRGPVNAVNGQAIAFIGDDPANPVIKERAAAATGHNITAQSIPEIQANFDSSIRAKFSAYVKSGGNTDAISASGAEDTPASTSEAALVEKSEQGSTKGVISRLLNRVSEKARSFKNRAKQLASAGRGAIAGVRRPAEFAGASGLSRTEFITGILSVPDWDAMLALYLTSVNEGVDVFRQNTPIRGESGRTSYKLVSLSPSEGGGFDIEVLGPETGGTLRDGYGILLGDNLI